MERWERRERKLATKRKRMRVTGRGLLTVIQPILGKRAEQAKRAGERRNSPARSAA